MNSDTHGPHSLLGRTIGGYQLVDILGDGLTGVVFLGERTEAVRGEMERTGRSAINWPEQVAIKLLILPWQLKDNERQEFRKRFERKAGSLQSPHQPNIMPLISFGHVAELDSALQQFNESRCERGASLNTPHCRNLKSVLMPDSDVEAFATR